jgi:hypothetical protein
MKFILGYTIALDIPGMIFHPLRKHLRGSSLRGTTPVGRHSRNMASQWAPMLSNSISL